MKKAAFLLTALLIIIGISDYSSAQGMYDGVTHFLQTRLHEAKDQLKRTTCQGEVLCGSKVLPDFYEKRSNKPAWFGPAGFSSQAGYIIRAVRQANREGLNPDDYHLKAIEAILDKKQLNARDVADLDLLLTDAFLLYGADLWRGRVDPEEINVQWAIRHEVYTDLAGVLEKGLEQNQVEAGLDNLKPPHRGYVNLKKSLSVYQQIASGGGWEAVPDGPEFKKGDRDSRIPLMRRRLIMTGDLSDKENADSDLFDDDLEQGIRSFQERHSLDVDGVPGKTTVEALNVPVSERIKEIKVNMERWRWLPHDFGQKYVVVNIAGFELMVVEHSKIVLEMAIIVGTAARRTPVFSNKIKYIVLNPYWEIPQSIAVKEIVPKVQKDPGYLFKQKIKVLSGWGLDVAEINPRAVDWNGLSKNFPYRLRQDPGPKNPLGRIKFMFPNKYDVYLHDTPSRSLFRRAKRGFSHGCIRLEKPFELAEYLLKDDPHWTKNRMAAEIKKQKTQVIKLPDPVNIYILYWTAWAEDDGTVYFGHDVYDRDESLATALGL